jgi:signal peptidase I
MKSRASRSSNFVKAFVGIVVTLIIIFFIRTYLFDLHYEPTRSMETTMLTGERFFADKLAYLSRQPERGDIVSFNYPFKVTNRVIGVPGDTVEGRIEDNKPVIYLNGKKLNEPYLNKYPLIAVRGGMKPGTIFKSYDPAMPFDKQPFYTIDEKSIFKNVAGNPDIVKSLILCNLFVAS